MFIPIREDEGTDYAYRVYMTKEQWKEVMEKLADGSDYTPISRGLMVIDASFLCALISSGLSGPPTHSRCRSPA
jgi:hypothetical protein